VTSPDPSAGDDAVGVGDDGSPAREAGSVVLVVGDVIDDVIVRPLEPVTRGSDTRSRIEPSLGGSGANQAAWLAACGAQVRFAGRVGRADLGRHRDAFASVGVDARLTADDERPTGTIVVIVDPGDQERTMYTDRGANLGLRPSDLPDDLLDDVALLHLSGYSLFDARVRAAVLDLVSRARDRGIPFSVDPASTAFLTDVGVDAFLTWIAGVTLLFPNLDEGRLLTGARDPEAIVAALHGHAEVVALKLGGDGAIVARRGGPTLRLPAEDGEVVDTTGAGDAFCGAFLAGWVEHGELDEPLVRSAIAAGFEAAGAPGARPR
jgi:sugar/nucleoside kinase (ribokinase family)